MARSRPGAAPRTTATARVHKALLRAYRRLRRTGVDYFRGDASDWPAFVALFLLCPLLVFLNIRQPVWCPPTALVLPILAGAFLLRPSSLVLLYAASAGGLSVESLVHAAERSNAVQGAAGYQAGVTPGAALVVGAVGIAGLLLAQFRSRVGVPWRRGGSMLFDLRERLRVQSQIPYLPPGWHAEMALRPAGGQSFSGDFVVAARTGSGNSVLEAVVADVSGKGMDAGSRALLLSGAFGGLLGSLPPHDFLPAANGYLLRQEWEEGFATAVHLALDLETGDYELLSAGHLPGMQMCAGAGRWEVKEAEGPLLGIYDGAKFEGVRGRLDRGDVLLLCTDGMVEAPGRDLSEGMDRLMGEADRLVAGGFRGAAWRLIETVAKDVNDDRALLLIWRE
ncbi:PP2C family protein-serine/threonine phosphatase [Peterkaempfera griseoplana]|uniref:PP2C family protein-serine/threonine phosphatase n=1 Tax=Peterkaempfera griseoplana TaxID=66896 RepID=UPI0006E420D6|nr:PP2C family protein-serine/threonine phosphatase [Peterkaempfera griseoplana]